MLGFSHCVDDGRITFRESVALKQEGYRVRIIGRARGDYLPGVCTPYGIPALALKSRYLQDMVLRFALEPFSRIKFLFICWKYSGWADVLHCHEYQSLTIGLILGKLRGQKVIYDCHEFQPELFAEMFGSEQTLRYKIIRWISSKIENYQSTLCDGIVTVNDLLSERFLKVNSRVCDLPNYPSIRLSEEKDVDVNRLDKLKFMIKDKFVIGFVGNLCNDRGVDTLIKAFGDLCVKRDDVVLLLVGSSSQLDLYRSLAKEYNILDKIFFSGSFKYTELATYLRLIDLGVYVPVTNNYIEYSCATKIFQYCAFGIPVILNSTYAHRDLIEKIEFGVLVDNNSVESLANILLQLSTDKESFSLLKMNAKSGFEKFWNAEIVVEQFINFYSQVLRKVLK